MSNDFTADTRGLGFCWYCATSDEGRDNPENYTARDVPAVTAFKGTPMCLDCAVITADERRARGKRD